ncbi:MAG: response regulator [Clostridiales bacterium]|nr:response regulator [Clostridiales bacterium]
MIPAGIIRNLKTQRVFSTMYSIYDDEHRVYRKRIQYAYLDEAAGQVVMTRTDVTDIMEEQKKQQDLLESALLAAKQASSAKTEFLSRMSHEIMTPMNAIIGMSAIAAQSIGNDEEIADCISKIGISSRFLLSLINDILDMSRIESGKMLLKNENIPFEEFVNGINTICFAQAQARNIYYECTVAPDVEECYVGDAMKLQQVVMNVLSNAIKFTPEGGRVSMNISQRKRIKDNAELRFVINDTGCGISEKFIPHIFEPFAQENTSTTSNYGGTGLGLAISKNIVDMMNGQINVRSIVGVGTEFTVDVNLGITDEARHKYRERASYNFTELKALVGDDDVTVCEYTGIILKGMGVQFEWVDSGRKAIDKVTAKWKSKESFDLVLLDWKMPDMDGIETAREIRRIVGPDITIIIMTAYDWASIEHEAKLAGVNLLMSKPMFKSSLMSAFEKVFGDKKEGEHEDIVTNFDFTGKRVLLAEDHPLNVEVATKLLEHRGFAVEHAENGLRALEMFTTTPVGYYDAILMDIRMPQMDGLQAASNIRHCRKKDAKTVPIIAMTANAFEDDIEKSMAAGMNAHLAKPIEPDVLYSTLAQWIFRK